MKGLYKTNPVEWGKMQKGEGYCWSHRYSVEIERLV